MTSVLDPAPIPPPTPGPPDAVRRRPGASGWFRAFWRWHFYASFLVAPVLLVLATTGLIYLLRFQLEPLMHADVMSVERPAGAQAYLPYSAQERAAAEAYPDLDLVSMAEPRELDRSTVFSATTASGEPREVYVDPWTAQVLGSLDPDGTLSGTAVRIHADLMAGPLGDAVIELAACWAVVMALTGYYLLVRGRRARQRQRRADAPGSALRRAHGRLGAVAGVGLLLLVVSGLPWTGFWGAQVQQLATGVDSSMWAADPGARSDPASTLDESLPHSHAVPWASEQAPVPRSDDPGAGPGERSVATVDTAVAVAERADLRHPMTVALPDGEDGVFSVIGYAFDAPSDEQTVHVDRFGGDVVSSYGYDDYPVLAKVVAQGIGLHEGRSLGAVSFLAALVTCLVVIAACVTGPLMWWRRRPSGAATLGAPRGRLPVGSSWVLLAGLVVLGVLLPFFGISVLVVLALDRFVLRRVPALAGWFGVTGAPAR